MLNSIRRPEGVSRLPKLQNVTCSGGRPLALTNGLNFGNPEKPEIFWQLREAVTGICEACQSLELPVTGGNVSLYNETEGEAVYPTPLIGVVGLVEHPEHETTQHWKQAGDVILLLGETEEELGAPPAAIHDRKHLRDASSPRSGKGKKSPGSSS